MELSYLFVLSYKFKAGELDFEPLDLRPLRINWLIVGISKASSFLILRILIKYTHPGVSFLSLKK